MKQALVILFCFTLAVCQAQTRGRFTDRVQALIAVAIQGDLRQLDAAWDVLRKSGSIPLIEGDSVAFLFRGQATSVEWMGDFNQWGYDKTFKSKGSRVGESNLWILKASFPEDARLDYKILINGSNWILDPANAHQQWSGVGGGSPNSELRMPRWRPEELQLVDPQAAKGSLEADLLLPSQVLGYQVTYSVYLPAGYQSSAKLPVIYVTDGFEYMHPKMGNMVTVLDNLIARKKIKPIVAVFIDHREPINRSNNKRMEELAMNSKYLQFFVDELIPLIESTYPVEPHAAARAIMGTSMGGLSSAYFVFAKPDVFSMAGIQSPSFWTRPQIYSLCEKANGTPIKISMTSGMINDVSESTRKMQTILEGNACTYRYREVNEGHSWGNWRNLIDDILIDFFGI
jgi:enterochelin esterase family protein